MPETTPAAAVIIPAYCVNAYIAEAIDAVLAQTFTDLEVLVVDDGQPEAATAELKRILARYDGRVRYYHRANGGQGAARNTAMQATRCEYVAFLDGDDYWAPTFLERMVGLLRADAGLAVAYANARFVGEGAFVGLTYMDVDPSCEAVTLDSLLGLRCNVTMSAVVARRDAVLDAGAFDERLRYVEDWDLWLRMAHRGMRFAYVTEPLAYRRLRETSLSTDGEKMDTVGLAVLERFAREHPLAERERQTWAQTAAWFRQELAVKQAKQRLETGDHRGAADALRSIGATRVNWKTRLALVGLVAAPGAVRAAYAGWRRMQVRRHQRHLARAGRPPAPAPTRPSRS